MINRSLKICCQKPLYKPLQQLEDLEKVFITHETASRIKKLLSEKDERTQKIFNMRVEGYSFSEIAVAVSLSEGSARVIDFRTKNWIKTNLGKEEI